MKANCKRLKADLALGVRKLGPVFLVLKLGEFLLFDGFLDLANFLPFKFPDLDNFRDLANFSGFGSIRFNSLFNSSPPPTSPTSLAASILAPSTSLVAITYNNLVVFSIDVSGTAILLKLLMNQR